MRKYLCILIVGLFSACSTVSYVGIETYNPAEVTFAENVTRILIVNNAVPQPSDSGYELNVLGVSQDTCRVNADSALFDACRSLGEIMVKAAYFNDVLLYHHATRTDSDCLLDMKLTSRQVADLCEETGTDAVISLDRLLFDMKTNLTSLPEGAALGMVDVQVAAVIRSYLPGREGPMATILMQDSVYWAEDVSNMAVLNTVLPKPDEALRMAGKYIGAKAYANFVPHWNKETRWYFTDLGSTWKEASAYVAGEKWDLAKERWERLYHNANTWKKKAKSASNLALCHEMKGDLKEAYEWAHKSYDLFKTNNGDNDKNSKLLQAYVETLAARIRSDKKLNIQFGKN